MLHDDCTLCMYKANYPPPGSQSTWCTPGNCSTSAASQIQSQPGDAAAAGIELTEVHAAAETTGCPLSGWQTAGYDKASRVADPQFVDPARRGACLCLV